MSVEHNLVAFNDNLHREEFKFRRLSCRQAGIDPEHHERSAPLWSYHASKTCQAVVGKLGYDKNQVVRPQHAPFRQAGSWRISGQQRCQSQRMCANKR
jgi:hypothetical protein